MRIEFVDDSGRTTESIEVVALPNGYYRIASVPLAVESVEFGDVIEVEPAAQSDLRFVRVVDRGGWTTRELFLPKGGHEASDVKALLRRVEQIGGHWEIVFGGVLYVCVPPEVDFDDVAG